MRVANSYDAVIIGGGFYGLRIGLHLRETVGLDSVLIIERDSEPMNRASYVNQARVHQGYHYPRSILTAYRSRVSLPLFVDEFSEAVVDDFVHYYAIANELSKVNSNQFQQFCDRIGAPLKQAPRNIADLFDQSLIEAVYEVEEPAFDSRILRSILLERIERVGGIQLDTGNEAVSVQKTGHTFVVNLRDGTSQRGERVFNATYSSLNEIQRNSGFQVIKLQHELTEMALVTLPVALQGVALTVMDGPFFSLMPFPDRKQHTLSHVRYTPHARWFEGETDDVSVTAMSQNLGRPASNFSRMSADVRRFIPCLRSMMHSESIWTVKTVLQRSAMNDSRPILFNTATGPDNYTVLMGGKIDNVYDALTEIDAIYER